MGLCYPRVTCAPQLLGVGSAACRDRVTSPRRARYRERERYLNDENRTWIRPRSQAWGSEAQRAVLHAIAEDVIRRSGHRVAAIEVLRSDGNLEFVAIAGSPDARTQLLGRAA